MSNLRSLLKLFRSITAALSTENHYFHNKEASINTFIRHINERHEPRFAPKLKYTYLRLDKIIVCTLLEILSTIIKQK